METKKFLCIEFKNADGEVVMDLCKCPAMPQDVNAALAFLKSGDTITITIEDVTISENGEISSKLGTYKGC